MDKIKIKEIIVVEGRYDAHAVRACFDTEVVELGGFGIFKNKDLRGLLKKYALERGLILLTDSDSAGFMIRARVAACVPAGTVAHAYVPDITGKESRKKAPSAENLLGVEGMSRDVLSRLLEPFATNAESVAKGGITKTDFFTDGLSGGANSSLKRAELARLAALPDDISANALLEALNILYSYDEYKEMISKIN